MFDFTNDPYGLKAVFVFMVILAVLMVAWDLIGFDSGGGGTPYGEYPYYEESI